MKIPLVIVLDNIRSAYNVGSVLRTADCAGVEQVITCGYTPAADHPKVKKTSLMAEDFIATEHCASLGEAIAQLLAAGYKVLAMEATETSENLWELDLPKEKIALIFGNEVTGVDLETTAKHNIPLVAIPMFGQKSSLNIASAAAIACYDLAKRWAR